MTFGDTKLRAYVSARREDPAGGSSSPDMIPPGQNGCPTSDEVRRDAPRDVGTILPTIETAIVEILSCPARPGETYLAHALRREHALRQIFDGFSVSQAVMFVKRLDADADVDRIAVAFRRFTPERRARLRAFVADTRRRAALAASRRTSKE